ncbi:hypothetical protein [Pseudofrankia sp. BMG5.37]|uniref:hypothetical protein n=1 Tax=Pseudofrankia sp. BMG5.37 TaxID=3050035 RepID=UPI0028943A1E|nr:hypothetical protein [Pseudofrankia sp. BMG5.37]MDT3441595.1 hypothetical protein [Pseudofrankia sp. BMG5.37]
MSGTDRLAVSAETAAVTDFERDLRAAFTEAAGDVCLPATAAAEVMSRGARSGRWEPRRRRLLVAVAAAVAVALVAAGAAVLPQVLRDDDRASVVPAGGASGPRPAVYGVSLGWLPDGMIWQRGDYSRISLDDSDDYRLAYQAMFASARPSGGPTPDPHGTVTVTVTRSGGNAGAVRSLDDWRRPMDVAASPPVLTPTTVSGHPAVLAAYSKIGWYLVYWVVDEPGGAQVGVEVLGADREAVLRIARAAVPGPPPTPVDRAGAIHQIHAAALAALDGSSGTEMLAAVADGARMRPALDKALRVNPVGLRGLRPVGFHDADVVFLSATEAVVAPQVFVIAGGPAPRVGPTWFVDTADGWKLTADSYCGVLTWVASAACVPG